MGSLEWLYGACSEIEVALECLARRQGFRPAYADNALKKIREKSPEYLAARRPSADPATDARELVRIIRQPTGRSPEESYESAEDRAAERLAPEIERFAQARADKAEAEAKELREALEQAYRDFDELSGAMEGDYDFAGIRNSASIFKAQARAALDAGKEE